MVRLAQHGRSRRPRRNLEEKTMMRFSIILPMILALASTGAQPMSGAAGSGYETYTVWGRPDGEIGYSAPSGISAFLQPSACTPDQWCCSPGFEICYYDFSGNQEDELQLTLEGARSLACTLLHFEDDVANRLYMGTDADTCHSGEPCLKLREVGSTGPPVDPYEGFKIICF
jgi:hypothetical protein